MKTSSPPLENKGTNPLDGPMKDNLGVNTEPEMRGSLGTPKPNMKSGSSKGALHGGNVENTAKKDSFAETGYHNDEY